MGWQDGTPVSQEQPAWMQGKPIEPAKSASLLDSLLSPLEVARSVGQNILAAGVGNAQAVAEDIGGKILGRKPINAQERAEEIAQKLGYQSKNPVANRMLESVSDIAKSEPLRLLSGIGPGGGVVGELANVTKGAPVVAQVAGATAKPIEAVTKRVRVPERAMAGGGAAVTEAEMLRRQRAGDLPVPIQLSKGEATRDFGALRLEKEGMKETGKGGDALRTHAADNVENVLKNFESWIDETGAQAPDLIATGKAIDRPLIKRMESAKAEIRNAYDKAEKKGDMAQPVKTDALVNWVNENQSSSKLAPIIKVTEDEMIRMGGATRDATGQLIAKEMPINEIEKMRKRIIRDSKSDATNQHYGGEANGVIDLMTEGQGGDLYKQARSMFKDYASEFKNQGAVRKLVSVKPGTTDRTVALEDVWKHVVLSGSNQDTQNIIRSLEKAGPDGAQAINEIRGRTMNYIMDETFKNSAKDIRGNTIPLYDKAKKVINTLDSDGKLELLFGKKGAEQLRDIRDVIGDIQSAPPGVINQSNTAAVLKEAMEAMVTGRLPTALAKGMAGVRSAINENKTSKQYIQQLKQPE